MAKAPAVQFYVSDFLTGTTLMTNEEVGLYIRLLCLQAENGSVPDDPERMSIVYGPSVAKCWPAVRAKFISGEQPGTMVNEKMVKVLADREAFRKKQSDKGKASAEARLSYGSKKKKSRSGSGSTVVEPLEGEGRGIVKEKERANEVEIIPEGFTVEHWRSIQRWFTYREQSKKKLTQMSKDDFIKKWKAKGEAATIAAIDNSIEKGYQGCFEPDATQRQNGKLTEDQERAARFAHIAALYPNDGN